MLFLLSKKWGFHYPVLTRSPTTTHVIVLGWLIMHNGSEVGSDKERKRGASPST
jgi:hypothetical protein